MRRLRHWAIEHARKLVARAGLEARRVGNESGSASLEFITVGLMLLGALGAMEPRDA